MREVEFRALKDDMSDCSFVYGNLVYDEDANPYIGTIKGGKYSHVSCFKGTEGQYTGFKDSRRIKIFEGDIIRGKNYDYDEMTLSVNFFELGFVALDCYRDQVFPMYCDGEDDIDDFTELIDLEIIGNIHETPELLES